MYVPGARRPWSAFSLVSTCTGEVMLAWNSRKGIVEGEGDLEPRTSPIRQPRTLFVYNWAVFSTSVQVEKDICDRGEADIG